jgi:cell wall-associated NlpC family hydrolase
MHQGPRKTAFSILFLSLTVCAMRNVARAQQELTPALTKFTTTLDRADLSQRRADPKSLLLEIGAQIRETELDCSHFVQNLYEQAGLYYGYAPSRILYAGMDGFKRVLHPKPGDLIVWQGHVGIVVDPAETTFLSALRSGVKISSYESHYWKRRGKPHFLRFVGSVEDVTTQWATRRVVASRGSSSGE